MTPPVDPALLRLGPLTLYGYGVLVAGGILLGSVIRFLMDSWRTDSTPAQGLAPAFIAAAVAFLALRYQPWRSFEKARARA